LYQNAVLHINIDIDLIPATLYVVSIIFLLPPDHLRIHTSCGKMAPQVLPRMNILPENPPPRKDTAGRETFCYLEPLAAGTASDIARLTASCSSVFPRSFSPEKKLVTQ